MLLKIESHMVSIHVIYIYKHFSDTKTNIEKDRGCKTFCFLFRNCCNLGIPGCCSFQGVDLYGTAKVGQKPPARPSTWFKSWTSCRSGGCWVKKLIFKVIGWFGMSGCHVRYSIVSCCFFRFILSWFVTCFGYVMCWLVSGFAMVDEVNMRFVFYMLHHRVCNIACHDVQSMNRFRVLNKNDGPHEIHCCPRRFEYPPEN